MTNEVIASALELASTNGLQDVIFDGDWTMWIGIVPWFSTLIVPVVVVRSLFLLKCRKSDKAKRSARRSLIVLHIQSVFALVTGTWMSLAGMLSLRRYLEPGAAFLAMQNLNMSHMLWLVAYQCFIATAAALIVTACSGLRPRLWQPRFAVVSICFCIVAEAISIGVFGSLRN